MPRDGVVYSYLNDETGEFLSFYSIPYDTIDNSVTVNEAYLFYMTGDNFNDAFLIAKNEGFDVECIAPQAAIYLTVKIGVLGKTTSSGQKLTNAEEIAFFLINEAGVAIVPFYAFGGSRESEWFRISVGTIRVSDIAEIGKNLKKALSTLQ